MEPHLHQAHRPHSRVGNGHHGMKQQTPVCGDWALPESAPPRASEERAAAGTNRVQGPMG